MTRRPEPRGPLAVLLLAVLLLAVLLLAAACDTTFDPFEERDLHYSLYGYLDAAADSQQLRVVPIRPQVLPADLDPASIRVTLTSLDGSVVPEAWQGRLTRFGAADSVGLLYAGAPDLVPGRSYRIEVTGDAGTSRATVRLPDSLADPVFLPPNPPGNNVFRRVQWPGVRNPARVEVVYRVRNGESAPVRTVVLPYLDLIARQDDGIQLPVDFRRDAGAVFRTFNLAPGTPRSAVWFDGLELRVAEGDTAWTFLHADFDLETLAIPGRFSNVEQGLGFVGGLVRRGVPWDVEPEVVEVMGFTDGRDDDRGAAVRR